MESNQLPPDIEAFAALLAQESPEVRAVMRYALVLLMIDDEKAHQVKTRAADGKEFLRVRTVAGEEFEIERPALSPNAEQMLLDQLRQIIAEN